MAYISKEMVEFARRIDLLTYMQTYEPQNLRRVGPNRYKLIDHDSVEVAPGKWYRFSAGYGGRTALDFLIKVRDMAFVDACEYLLGKAEYEPPIVQEKQKEEQKEEERKADFRLPPAHSNNFVVIEYLKSRQIAPALIEHCIENGSIYQSRKYNDCVFVGFDKDGDARFGCIRGIGKNLKRDLPGSDKRFGFCLSPKRKSDVLLACESPIEVLSHATLFPDFEANRISLSGVSGIAIKQYVHDHPHINRIILALNNDRAGHEGAQNIIKSLPDEDIVCAFPPDDWEDFNQFLKVQMYIESAERGTEDIREMQMGG